MNIYKTAIILLFISFPLFSNDVILMRVSTDNYPEHIQTKIVADFVNVVNEKLGDKIKAVHYHSGKLFRDKDVVGALSRGQAEMAVVGNWHVDKYELKAGLFLLPSFYNLTQEKLNLIRDGELGNIINSAIEEKTGVVVLGRWIDLGYAHIYSLTDQINSYKDLKDKRIRVAGGIANVERIRALGANAVAIGWGDLKNAIKSKKIDGILTTHETIASNKLWEEGVGYCYEDKNYFPMYIPMVSAKFFNTLREDLRIKLKVLWEEQVDSSRAKAAKAQNEARDILIKNGIKIIVAKSIEKSDAKKVLLQKEKILLENLNIDELFYEKFRKIANE